MRLLGVPVGGFGFVGSPVGGTVGKIGSGEGVTSVSSGSAPGAVSVSSTLYFGARLSIGS